VLPRKLEVFVKHEPFLCTITVTGIYVPPKKLPTLDALLWGAARLATENDIPDLLDIPLKMTDGVFHGSSMLCDPMFSVSPVRFFQSIYNERQEDDLSPAWLDTKLYKNSSVGVHDLKSGTTVRGTFSVKENEYAALSRGKSWEVGFYGCGDLNLVESMLHLLPGIGKKASRGYGAITGVNVKPEDQDLSMMREGLPMRPIPVELWDRLSGRPLPTRKARAVVCDGNPDDHEVWCVTPNGARLPW
jgi:hypothetical protein